MSQLSYRSGTPIRPGVLHQKARMLISKEHDFGFVHVPKCAGSTIRQQLRHLDDLGGRFYHTMTLPDLGMINGNHVLLEVLESHFPEVLEALRAVTSYAIIREPAERFRSAVAQYLRSHVAEPSELSKSQLLEATTGIVADLRVDVAQRKIANTVFYRQADYIYLHGEKVVDHVYPMEDIAGLMHHLSAVHGLALQHDTVWNPTVTYRIPGSSGPLKRLKGAARRVLPTRGYAALRDLGVRTFTSRGVPRLEEVLSGSALVEEFVAEHYADDLALYQRIRAEAEANGMAPS